MEIIKTEKVKEYMESLDIVSKADTTKMINLLEKMTYSLRMPFSKKIIKNIFELRIKSVQNVRIYYFYKKYDIVLFHGMNKKTDKISKKELRNIIRLFKYYIYVI